MKDNRMTKKHSFCWMIKTPGGTFDEVFCEDKIDAEQAAIDFLNDNDHIEKTTICQAKRPLLNLSFFNPANTGDTLSSAFIDEASNQGQIAETDNGDGYCFLEETITEKQWNELAEKINKTIDKFQQDHNIEIPDITNTTKIKSTEETVYVKDFEKEKVNG